MNIDSERELGRENEKLRIAVGGFLHESHSFAPRPTRYVDFVNPGGWMGLSEGAQKLADIRGKSAPLAGAVAISTRNSHSPQAR